MTPKIRRVDFSPDEWLCGTLTMKADERGCYITICALIYSNGGPIADSDRDLVHACNVTPERWVKIKNTLIGAGKIVATGGMIGNRRCEIELEKARNRTEKARANGAGGGVRSGESRRKSAGNRGEIAMNSTGNPSEIEANSEDVSSNNNAISEADASSQNEANKEQTTKNKQQIDDERSKMSDGEFERFYSAYPRHVGRGQALKAYRAARKKTDAATLLAAAAAALDRAQPLTESVSGLLSSAEGLVEAGRGRSRREVLETLVEQVHKPAAIDPTGLPSLDRAMGGGLHRGRVYALAGLSKRGKTMFATTISHHLNNAGTRHAYVALDMGSVEIEQRQAARDLRVSSMNLTGNVNESLRKRLVDYALSAKSFTHYIDLPGGTIDELRAEVLSAVHRHGCRGLVVDYWQLISGRDRGVSEEEHIRGAAQWLAKAAKRLKIWVLVLAQLADDGEGTAVSRTGLNRAADQVYFIRGDADSDLRWLEMRASRYTPVGDIGAKLAPAFKIVQPGPHVRDLGAEGAQ